MNRFRWVFILVLWSSVCSLQAQTQPNVSGNSQDVTPDVRCLVVSGMGISVNTDPSLQTAGIASLFFYLGRLDGRTPKPDIEALVTAESPKMTPADVKSETARCGF